MTEKTQREAFYQGAHWGLGRAAAFVRDGGDIPEWLDARIQEELAEVLEKLKKYEREEW